MTYLNLRKQLYTRVSVRVDEAVRDPLGRRETMPGPATDIENQVDDIAWNQIGYVVWNDIRDEISRK